MPPNSNGHGAPARRATHRMKQELAVAGALGDVEPEAGYPVQDEGDPTTSGVTTRAASSGCG